jgi:hypothetical protein
LPRGLRGLILLVCIAGACTGCTHSMKIPPGSQDPQDSMLLETTCEDNLQYLGKIIKELSAKTGTPDARLVEATEIYRLAESLYLQREFILASELIEEAVNRLEEPGD